MRPDPDSEFNTDADFTEVNATTGGVLSWFYDQRGPQGQWIASGWSRFNKRWFDGEDRYVTARPRDGIEVGEGYAPARIREAEPFEEGQQISLTNGWPAVVSRYSLDYATETSNVELVIGQPGKAWAWLAAARISERVVLIGAGAWVLLMLLVGVQTPPTLLARGLVVGLGLCGAMVALMLMQSAALRALIAERAVLFGSLNREKGQRALTDSEETKPAADTTADPKNLLIIGLHQQNEAMKEYRACHPQYMARLKAANDKAALEAVQGEIDAHMQRARNAGRQWVEKAAELGSPEAAEVLRNWSPSALPAIIH